MSAVSSPDFFRSGVTIVCFCEVGSRPWASDVLTILVMYGSKTSMNSRTRNVGIESSDDDFTGDDITIFRTSDSVHRRNDDSEDDAGTDIDGGCRPAVSFRTASTLAAKNSAKLVAVWSVAPSTFRSRYNDFAAIKVNSFGTGNLFGTVLCTLTACPCWSCGQMSRVHCGLGSS